MTRYVRLLRLFARTELQYALEYRLNFALEIMQMIVVAGTSVAAVLILFSYTTVMNGWTLGQMIVLLGVYYMVQGAEELVLQPSMERFMEHVREGTLDFVLLKPVSSQFMVSFRHFQTVQTLQVVLGLSITVLGVAGLATTITLASATAFAVTLACGWLGISERLEPTPESTGSAYSLDYELPRSLSEALTELRACTAFHKVLGRPFIDVYLAVKELEYAEFMKVISPWEREHLLLHV